LFFDVLGFHTNVLDLSFAKLMNFHQSHKKSYEKMKNGKTELMTPLSEFVQPHDGKVSAAVVKNISDGGEFDAPRHQI